MDRHKKRGFVISVIKKVKYHKNRGINVIVTQNENHYTKCLKCHNIDIIFNVIGQYFYSNDQNIGNIINMRSTTSHFTSHRVPARCS